MTETATTAVVLGEGRLNWHRYERVGDRYGAVNLCVGEPPDDPLSPDAPDDWPDPLEVFADAPVGRVGALRAEVLEARESGHIGDLAYGIGPPAEQLEPGAVVELGHGELFLEADRGVGVRPDRELAVEGLTSRHDWLACPTCGPLTSGSYGEDGEGNKAGDGRTPGARQIAETFYAHGVGGFGEDPARNMYRWCDKLTQAEVDHLLEQGRLSTWVKDDSERGGGWEAKPKTAELRFT